MHAGVLATGGTRHLQENVQRQLDERISSRSELCHSLNNGAFGEDILTSFRLIKPPQEAASRSERLSRSIVRVAVRERAGWHKRLNEQ